MLSKIEQNEKGTIENCFTILFYLGKNKLRKIYELSKSKDSIKIKGLSVFIVEPKVHT